MRIVSLIASATEIVCALGLGDRIVARSHECDYPATVKTLPACTSPKFDVEGLSYQIDERVKAIVQEGLSVYRVDASMLESLQPTHIITQSQCEVCAVSLKDVEEAVCQFTSSRPVIVTLEPDKLEDIWTDFLRVGSALACKAEAEDLVSSLKVRINAIRERALSSNQRPRIAFIEWIDPLMAGGNWMPELIELAGAVSLFGTAGRHSPFIAWEDVAKADPDIILVSPCGFDIDRTMQEAHLLKSLRGWNALKAVKNNEVMVADGNRYFNRPGPRLVESLEILAEVSHPDMFAFGHEGDGWCRLA